MAECRSCGAEIQWMKTKKGKNVPLDPKRITIIMDDGSAANGRISHFATCPQADSWRRGEEKEDRGDAGDLVDVFGD